MLARFVFALFEASEAMIHLFMAARFKKVYVIVFSAKLLQMVKPASVPRMLLPHPVTSRVLLRNEKAATSVGGGRRPDWMVPAWCSGSRCDLLSRRAGRRMGGECIFHHPGGLRYGVPEEEGVPTPAHVMA